MSEHCPQPQAHPARCGCEEVENHLERQVDIERINYGAALQSRLDAAEKRARKAEADAHRILKTYRGLERLAGVVSDNSDQVCSENNLLRQQLAKRDVLLRRLMLEIASAPTEDDGQMQDRLGKWEIQIEDLLSATAQPAEVTDQALNAGRYLWLAKRDRWASVSVDFDRTSTYNRHRITWHENDAWLSVDGQSLEEAIDKAMAKTEGQTNE